MGTCKGLKASANNRAGDMCYNVSHDVTIVPGDVCRCIFRELKMYPLDIVSYVELNPLIIQN